MVTVVIGGVGSAEGEIVVLMTVEGDGWCATCGVRRHRRLRSRLENVGVDGRRSSGCSQIGIISGTIITPPHQQEDGYNDGSRDKHQKQ